MHRIAWIGLVPVLFVAAGGAQSPPIVTEAEFLSVLDESHPAVAAEAEALALARARLVEAETLENPVVGVVREDPSGEVEQTDVLVSWQLPHAARRPQIEAREQTVRAASARVSQRLVGLRLEMRALYAQWALAAARRERLSAQAARVHSLTEREAARAERGEASGLEAYRLELAAASLRSRLALAAAAGERARAQVRRWFPDLAPDARPVLPPLPPAPQLAAEHLLVRAAEADLAAASQESRATRRFVASPELSMGWQRQEAGLGAIEGPILGLAWSLPLFDRNRAEKAAAEARVAGARARLELVEREVAAARAAARAAYERLEASVEEAVTSLAANERMLDGVEAAFRLGEASLTDLLETHRSVTEAQLAVLELHGAALAAHRELERLAAPADSSDDPSDPTLQDLQENVV